MTMDNNTIAVSILNRPYQIKCAPGTAEKLVASAAYLDAKMRALQETANTCNTERLAVVVALNVVQELMQAQDQKNNDIDQMHEQIKILQKRIQEFLTSKDEVLA